MVCSTNDGSRVSTGTAGLGSASSQCRLERLERALAQEAWSTMQSAAQKYGCKWSALTCAFTSSEGAQHVASCTLRKVDGVDGDDGALCRPPVLARSLESDFAKDVAKAVKKHACGPIAKVSCAVDAQHLMVCSINDGSRPL